MQKILGIIGWIGTALVFGAVADPHVLPGLEPVRDLRGVGRSRHRAHLHGRTVARRRRRSTRAAAPATAPCRSSASSCSSASSSAINYLGTRQNKRWDFTANQVYSLSDQTIKILKDLKEPVTFTVYERQDRQDMHRDRLDEFTYQSSQVKTEYVDPDRAAGARDRGEDRNAADDPDRVPRAAPSA